MKQHVRFPYFKPTKWANCNTK